MFRNLLFIGCLSLCVGGIRPVCAQRMNMIAPATPAPATSPTPQATNSDGTLVTPAPSPTPSDGSVYTDSTWGVASTRRNDPAFVGLLKGLQAAASATTGKEMNVAPTTKETLEDEVSDLTSHGVKSLIIDSPNANDAAKLIENAKFLQINVVLITQAATPETKDAPTIVLAPSLFGTVGGEVARDALKNEKKVRVVYLVSGPYEDILRKEFLAAFDGKSDQYDLVEATEQVQIHDDGTPTILAALSPSDTSRLQTYLADLPLAWPIGVGDTAGVQTVFELNVFQFRMRSDFEKIFAECQRMVGNPAGAPVVLKPVVDKAEKPRPAMKK